MVYSKKAGMVLGTGSHSSRRTHFPLNRLGCLAVVSSALGHRLASHSESGGRARRRGATTSTRAQRRRRHQCNAIESFDTYIICPLRRSTASPRLKSSCSGLRRFDYGKDSSSVRRTGRTVNNSAPTDKFVTDRGNFPQTLGVFVCGKFHARSSSFSIAYPVDARFDPRHVLWRDT
jgi:hypothetical protein